MKILENVCKNIQKIGSPLKISMYRLAVSPALFCSPRLASLDRSAFPSRLSPDRSVFPSRLFLGCSAFPPRLSLDRSVFPPWALLSYPPLIFSSLPHYDRTVRNFSFPVLLFVHISSVSSSFLLFFRVQTCIEKASTDTGSSSAYVLFPAEEIVRCHMWYI